MTPVETLVTAFDAYVDATPNPVDVAETTASMFLTVFMSLTEARKGNPDAEIRLTVGNRRVTIHAVEPTAPEVVRVK